MYSYVIDGSQHFGKNGRVGLNNSGNTPEIYFSMKNLNYEDPFEYMNQRPLLIRNRGYYFDGVNTSISVHDDATSDYTSIYSTSTVAIYYYADISERTCQPNDDNDSNTLTIFEV